MSHPLAPSSGRCDHLRPLALALGPATASKPNSTMGLSTEVTGAARTAGGGVGVLGQTPERDARFHDGGNGSLREAMSALVTSTHLFVLAAAVALAGCNAATPIGHPSVPPPPRAAAARAPASDLPVAEDASTAAPPGDAPRIAVVGDRVFLDSVEVGDVRAILASHRPMWIEELSNALKAAAQKHPTGGLIAVFAFGADTTAAVVKSVMQTVAAAGYPYARLVVRTAGDVGYLNVDARVAAPPPDVASSVKPPGTSTTYGRLAPEIIQRIVRTHFGEFKHCFEDALRTTPDLAGTVRIKFVITTDGHVSSAVNSASTLPDPTVVVCVARAFESLVFPSPEGGVVTVEYPIIFSPGAP